MTWADFYLICFAVGFLFSVFSFLSGGLHMHGHWPHLHFHTGGHASTPGSGVNAGHGAAHANSGTSQVSPVNLFTVAMFLAWFGGTGYLLTRYSTLVFALALLISIAVGTIGGTSIFLFMSKVLMSENENMDPADYEMAGVLGRISSSIREGGTGEIIYSQAGTRRTCGARSEDGCAIAKGDEVVVTRYEKGIAYVRRWEEMTAESDHEDAGVNKPGRS
jgi:membrane protein implicated in regulation of membrane protease activity